MWNSIYCWLRWVNDGKKDKTLSWCVISWQFISLRLERALSFWDYFDRFTYVTHLIDWQMPSDCHDFASHLIIEGKIPSWNDEMLFKSYELRWLLRFILSIKLRCFRCSLCFLLFLLASPLSRHQFNKTYLFFSVCSIFLSGLVWSVDLNFDGNMCVKVGMLRNGIWKVNWENIAERLDM